MGYRVLVTDDERNITEGLKLLIERYIPECQVVALAFDGRQGIAAAEAFQPDIILTDIRMPDMDGLEMIRQIRERGGAAHFIILSGYAEFSYAKTAITLGVEEYITKPVEEEELMSAFAACMEKIRMEREQSIQQAEMKDQLAHYGQNVLEYTLKSVLQGDKRRKAEWMEALKPLGFPGEEKSYAMVIVDVEEIHGSEEEMLLDVLRGLCARELKHLHRQYVFSGDHRDFLVLACGKEDNQRSYENQIRRLRILYEERIGRVVSIGAGLLHSRPEQIREAFEEARCALNYKVIQGSGSVIFYQEIQHMQDGISMLLPEELKQLEQSIDKMDDEACEAVIDQIFHRLKRENELSLESLRMLSLQILLTGVRRMPLLQSQLNEYLGRNIFSLDCIEKFKTIEQLRNWIINVLKGMNELMIKGDITEKRDVVEEVKRYLYKNYAKNITLQDISERFYINPYYFSQLFKKKTGETYQRFLTNLRISRAKKLIEETELRIYEVCELVGYTDTNHFNRLFEKNVGMKPSEYRKKSRGQNL